MIVKESDTRKEIYCFGCEAFPHHLEIERQAEGSGKVLVAELRLYGEPHFSLAKLLRREDVLELRELLNRIIEEEGK